MLVESAIERANGRQAAKANGQFFQLKEDGHGFGPTQLASEMVGKLGNRNAEIGTTKS